VDGEADLNVALAQAVPVDGVDVRYFRVPALRRLFWSPSMKRYLRDATRTFDIVHLHSVYLWPTAMAAHQARRARVPYVISPRGMLVQDVIKRKNRWIKTAWIQLVEKRSLALAAGLHVTAELEADEAAKLGLDLPTIHCIPNGIDIPHEHSPLESGPFANVPRPYALFLSRISWKKGLDRLIKAWSKVERLQLLIVGNDDENYIPQLQAMPEFAAVRDRVSFLGPASDLEKWALYKNAQLFVLPSYSENFGNVVAEAMAMSCPIVLTPEVGLAEFVRTHAAGTITTGEPDDLAEKINSLANDEAMRTAMGCNGNRAVMHHLSWDAVARQMEQTYRGIVTSRVK
jgi:glycosyltransferase involved in cell wall biosynthesis